MNSDPNVFGLSEAQLRPILESAIGQSASSFSTSIRHRIKGHPGYRGEKRIPTFEYTTSDGTSGEAVMFVKKLCHPKGGNAEQATFLAKRNAPIPRLYGTLRDNEGYDIIFLEHLPIVYRDEEVYSSPILLQRFISLAASLNTLPLPQSHGVLPNHEDVSKIPESRIPALVDAADHSTRGDLGDELKEFFGRAPSVLPDLKQVLHCLSTMVAGFPLGLVHGDFSPFHTGSRASSPEMLAIDFGCVSVGPRFFDIAPFLAPPDVDMDLCMSCEEIARHYVNEYNARSGSSMCPKEVLLESNAVWAAWNARRIPWLLPQALEGEQKARAKLHRLLSRLLEMPIVSVQNMHR
jgi:hypothetical protein